MNEEPTHDTIHTAVVTGSSSGLGRHLAKVLLNLGWVVHGIDRSCLLYLTSITIITHVI